MSIISFRCHTTIHLAPLVNQETIHQDMDRGQQLMSRINQGILREIKPKNHWLNGITGRTNTQFRMSQSIVCLRWRRGCSPPWKMIITGWKRSKN